MNRGCRGDMPGTQSNGSRPNAALSALSARETKVHLYALSPRPCSTAGPAGDAPAPPSWRCTEVAALESGAEVIIAPSQPPPCGRPWAPGSCRGRAQQVGLPALVVQPGRQGAASGAARVNERPNAQVPPYATGAADHRLGRCPLLQQHQPQRASPDQLQERQADAAGVVHDQLAQRSDAAEVRLHVVRQRGPQGVAQLVRLAAFLRGAASGIGRGISRRGRLLHDLSTGAAHARPASPPARCAAAAGRMAAPPRLSWPAGRSAAG